MGFLRAFALASTMLCLLCASRVDASTLRIAQSSKMRRAGIEGDYDCTGYHLMEKYAPHLNHATTSLLELGDQATLQACSSSSADPGCSDSKRKLMSVIYDTFRADVETQLQRDCAEVQKQVESLLISEPGEAAAQLEFVKTAQAALDAYLKGISDYLESRREGLRALKDMTGSSAGRTSQTRADCVAKIRELQQRDKQTEMQYSIARQQQTMMQRVVETTIDFLRGGNDMGAFSAYCRATDPAETAELAPGIQIVCKELCEELGEGLQPEGQQGSQGRRRQRRTEGVEYELQDQAVRDATIVAQRRQMNSGDRLNDNPVRTAQLPSNGRQTRYYHTGMLTYEKSCATCSEVQDPMYRDVVAAARELTQLFKNLPSSGEDRLGVLKQHIESACIVSDGSQDAGARFQQLRRAASRSQTPPPAASDAAEVSELRSVHSQGQQRVVSHGDREASDLESDVALTGPPMSDDDEEQRAEEWNDV